MPYLFGNAQALGQREDQQDAFAFSNPSDAEFAAHAGLLALLADGMGGMANGKAVSRFCVSHFLRRYREKTTEEPIADALERCLQSTIFSLQNEIQAQNWGDSGTTFIAAVLSENHLHWISVGDSALFAERDGELRQLNTPHTYATELDALVASGEMDPHLASIDPQREALTSFLGLTNPPCMDRGSLTLAPGESLLVASDGLFKTLDPTELGRHLRGSLQQRCDLLLDAVDAKGHPQQDNVTILCLSWQPPAPPDEVPAWKRLFKRLALLVFCIVWPLQAAPLENMKKQTVFIFVAYKTPKGDRSGTGSGIILDKTHVLTNFHVCCDIPKEYPRQAMVILGPKEEILLKPVWASPQLDLAILELEKPMEAPPILFAVPPNVKEGQNVWAMGFPGASLRAGNEKSSYSPSLSQGIVSKFLEQGEANDKRRLIQTTAAINPGNSGGPLFDDCGQVIAVNTAKAVSSLTRKGERQEVYAEGISLSVSVEEAFAGLEQLKLPIQKGEACMATPLAAPERNWTLMIQVASLLLALGALFVALQRRAQKRLSTQMGSNPVHASHPASVPEAPSNRAIAQAAKTLTLACTAGPLAGQNFPLGTVPCIIGRDPQVANIVFPSTTPGISKRHCTLTYEASSGKIFLEDNYSTHGTLLKGKRIEAGRRHEVRQGEAILLGDEAIRFEVYRSN